MDVLIGCRDCFLMCPAQAVGCREQMREFGEPYAKLCAWAKLKDPQVALHIAISAVNILTDLFLVVFPCSVIYGVKLTSQSRRWSIMILFSTRLL